MEFGIDEMDPYGVGALFLGQSMARQFHCGPEVRDLFEALTSLETPQLPTVPVAEAVGPVDELLDRLEPSPWMIELVDALFRLGVDTPPVTSVSQRLYRAAQWLMMRHAPDTATDTVLEVLRDATPGARVAGDTWPGHDFFASIVVLIYLGGRDARAEMEELLEAARDLRYDDLAPVLEWYLDHRHSAPSR
ncbi:MAG: hypothetical protein ACK5RL_07485 [Acidimicrobiales bacterium]